MYEYRDLAVVQDLGGLAAEQQALDPAMAMRSHHDEIAAIRLGDADDRLVYRMIELGDCLAGHAGGAGRIGDRVEDFRRGLAHQLVVFGRVVQESGWHLARDGRLVGWLHVERGDLGAEVAGNPQARLDCFFRQRRTVADNQDRSIHAGLRADVADTRRWRARALPQYRMAPLRPCRGDRVIA